MTVPSPEPDIPVRLHGLHPLQSPRRRADRKPGGLRGPGCYGRRLQGNTEYYHCERYPVLLRGWPAWI